MTSTNHPLTYAASPRQFGMLSPRAFLGSLSVLVALPIAVLTNLAFGSGEVIAVHAALGVGMLLLAAAAFDFRISNIAGWVGMTAMVILGTIFLAQGVGEIVQSPALFAIVYGDPTIQAVERLAAYPILIWCAAILLTHSRGWRRHVGAIALAAIGAVEVYTLWVAYAGGAPDIMLRLTYLLAFAWLALEGGSRWTEHPRPATLPAESR
jgi:hypothetical protein